MTGTWNPSDNAGLALSNGNLTATNTAGSGVWYTCRATPLFEPSNRVYAEFTATNVGVSDSAVYIAVMNGNAALSLPGLFDANSFGYNQNGSTTYNGVGATLATWTTGNVICFAVDGNVGKVWVRVNNGNWDNDGTATANPSSNTGGISCPNLFNQGGIFFGTSIHTVNYAITGNFNGTFAYAVPSGFAALPPVTSALANGIAASGIVGQPDHSVLLSIGGQTAAGGQGTVLPTTSAIRSVGSTGLSGSFTSKLLDLTLTGASATGAASLITSAEATTIYNYEGFDHETAQADLLQGIIWNFINSTGSISALTPYAYGNSLAVQVVNNDGTSAVAGYAVYNCGPFTLSQAVLGVMTQSSIFANVNTDIGFLIGTTAQLFCRLVGNNITVYRGPSSDPTLLQTVLNVIPASGWFYLELTAVIAPGTDGSIVINVNGIQVASLSNLNTSVDGTSHVNGILLGGSSPAQTSSTFLFDDVYVATSLLGPMRVATMFPNANGNQVQFLASGSTTNWQNVDELAMDSDKSYNFSSAFALIDEFALSALPTTITDVVAFKVTMAARKDSTSARSMSTLVLSNLTTSDGVPTVLSNDYQYVTDVYLLDPDTGTSWTRTSLNAAQIGYTIR